MEFIGFIVALLGAGVFIISGIGILRMPDFFTRMHAGTKASTLGILFICIGMSFYEPSWAFKLLLLALFVILTNPLSSSVVALASYRSGEKFINTSGKDALAQEKQKKEDFEK
jgi:multicomponent Na+:H+ antiporter subunit G